MTKVRKRSTAEFKAAAVSRLDEAGKTLSSVARALDVTATQLRNWRLEQQAAGSAEAVARRKAEAAELQQLRRENKRLQEENEILRRPRFLSRGGRRQYEHETHLHLCKDRNDWILIVQVECAGAPNAGYKAHYFSRFHTASRHAPSERVSRGNDAIYLT